MAGVYAHPQGRVRVRLTEWISWIGEQSDVAVITGVCTSAEAGRG
jgi:hypothetical protein